MKKFILAIAVGGVLASSVFAEKRTSFTPGELWPDDKGVHINAHGGGILFHEGTYYWFGEHKIEGTAGNRAHVGVHVYSSKDLYNWTDEGIALTVSDDPEHPLAKGCVIERPKVIFNKKTGKFVMWFHHELLGYRYASALSGVAVSDTPTGPYTFVKSIRPNAGSWPLNAPEEVRTEEAIGAFAIKHAGKMNSRCSYPGEQEKEAYGNRMRYWNQNKDYRTEIYRRDFESGQFARDMALFVDDDGTAYHIFSSESNLTLHISKLTDDYLSHAGEWVRVLVDGSNEAPAICKRNGKFYLIASGCTGWAPNAARGYVADSIFGPYKSIGNPAKGTNPQNKMGPGKTWGGQSTFILPVQGTDTFIAMFDIWRPENAIDGRYIWLPIDFEDDSFSITWKNEWSLQP